VSGQLPETDLNSVSPTSEIDWPWKEPSSLRFRVTSGPVPEASGTPVRPHCPPIQFTERKRAARWYDGAAQVHRELAVDQPVSQLGADFGRVDIGGVPVEAGADVGQAQVAQR
jgi:hypothetical protein